MREADYSVSATGALILGLGFLGLFVWALLSILGIHL